MDTVQAMEIVLNIIPLCINARHSIWLYNRRNRHKLYSRVLVEVFRLTEEESRSLIQVEYCR